MKLIFLIFLSLFIFTGSAQARLLPQAGKSAKPTTTKATVKAGISVYPKLRADRRALTINFANLQNAKSVSYALIYQTAIQEEGAIGSINLTNSNTKTEELLFGTCSKNVCRYHTNIKNARLEVSYTTKSGKKYLRRYRIKV